MKKLEKMFKEAGLYSLDSPWIIEATDERVFAVVKAYMKAHYALSNPLEQSEKKEEWVSVDERLPETQAWCLCAIKGGVLVYACEYFHTIKQWYGYGDAFPETRITHWQPLPNPPQNLV